MTSAKRKTIREVVRRLLVDNQIHSAPVPVVRIAKNLGIMVRKAPDSDELCGFLFFGPSGDTVIGVNEAHHRNRRRFTVAHELGHYFLHKSEKIHVDALSNYTIERRAIGAQKVADPKEIEANAFAAELLMPGNLLTQDLAALDDDVISDDDTVAELAEKYQVSVSAMSYRLANLGFITLK